MGQGADGQHEEQFYGHMVHEYYVERLREVAREREAARAEIRTKAQLAALQADVRRKLRRSFGPMPNRTPLNLRITGTVQRRDCVIEKLIYESRPGLPVTANLYLPRRSGPRPAVLGTCGHADAGKAHDLYQAFAKNLASQGYVVLIYDPLSQGERLQYIGCRGKAAPRGCCREHNMMGNQLHLCGEFFGQWRVWDGIRSLDVLLSRPEVDRSRVGLTGNSGGGTMTTYLTAFDRRFTMAAASCFVTRYLSNAENELPADSEQIPPGIIAAGLDLADFFVAHLPRPTLLLGQKNDYFDTRGLRATYEELRRLYRIAGSEDDIGLFIGPASHGFYVENREAMYRFFGRHAGVRAPAHEPKPLRVEKPELLDATPKGQVHFMRPRRVFDFIREKGQELATQRKPLAGRALADAIARRLALPERPAPPHYRVLRVRRAGKKTELWQSRFAVETERGVQAVLHLFSAKSEYYHLPPSRGATVYVPHVSSKAEVDAGQAPQAEPLFAVDLRGIGELTPRSCYDGEFFAPYGSDFFYASQGLMLAEPYSGRRVHDLLCVLDLLRAKGYRDVHLVGRGLGAIWAAFAAVLHPAVKRVTLENALLSYHELTQAPVQSWPMSALVYGVLEEFDLPDCLREISRTKRLALVDPWDCRMRPWRRGKLRAHLAALGLGGLTSA